MTGASAETTVTLPSDRAVELTRTLDAPRELVWDAFTKPEHVQQWLLGPDGWEMPICEIDLRPGGSWRYGWRSVDGSGEPFELRGEFREIAAPERIVHTERMGDSPEAVATLVLTEANGRTTMTQTVEYPSQEIRDHVLATGMTDGAGTSYSRLADYLKTVTR